MCRTYRPNTTEMRLTVPERAYVPMPQLWEWVDNEVLRHLNEERVFTAYGITRQLRARYPDFQIIHTDVQERVHAMMEDVSHYGMSWEIWNGEPARTYTPLGVVRKVEPAFIAAPALSVPVNILQAEPAQLAARFVRIDWDEKDD